MNATEFARRRGRIEHMGDRPHAWRTRAMLHLVRDAKAIVIVANNRVVGWQLPNGETVCIKQRYRDQDRADRQLAQIERADVRDKRPIRAYPCAHCGGWHLTSMTRSDAE